METWNNLVKYGPPWYLWLLFLLGFASLIRLGMKAMSWANLVEKRLWEAKREQRVQEFPKCTRCRCPECEPKP
jgi:hypothetical protein